jgi:protein-disulfide isomerase
MKSSRILAALGLALTLAAGAQAAEPAVRIKSVGTTAVLGRADAPVTMIEFSDYECTYCQQYHAVAFDSIKRDFIDSGKLRYVVRDFPLPMHRQAIVAARAARCAGEQGRFWEMRHAMFATTDLLDVDMLAELGRGLKLDEAALRSCVTSERHDAGIRKDMAEAASAGVNATPAFVLGRSVGEGVIGTRFEGSQPYAAYAARINALLEEPAAREGPAPGSAPR